MRRVVGEGLVEDLDDLGSSSCAVRADDELVVVGAEALGDQPRVVQLVEKPASSKPIVKVLTGSLGLAAGERGERARVDPPGEQHADRDVGDEVRAHGVVRARSRSSASSSARAPERTSAGRGPARPRVLVDPCARPDERAGAGGELARLAEDRHRGRHEVEGEVGLERLEVELARESGLPDQRLQLRGERERAAGLACSTAA